MHRYILCRILYVRAIYAGTSTFNCLSRLYLLKLISYCIMLKLKQRIGGASGVVGAWKKKNMVAAPMDDTVNVTRSTPQYLTVIYQGRRWGIQKIRSESKQDLLLKSQI